MVEAENQCRAIIQGWINRDAMGGYSGSMRISFPILALLAPLTLCAAAPARTPTQDGLVYSHAAGETLTMDYYAPKGKGLHPAAIIIHGGGYQRGDSKSGSEAYCADFLAPAGYAVFSVNYRLAPKYPYPYMVYDVERAIRYIRHNAAQWDRAVGCRCESDRTGGRFGRRFSEQHGWVAGHARRPRSGGPGG